MDWKMTLHAKSLFGFCFQKSRWMALPCLSHTWRHWPNVSCDVTSDQKIGKKSPWPMPVHGWYNITDISDMLPKRLKIRLRVMFSKLKRVLNLELKLYEMYDCLLIFDKCIIQSLRWNSIISISENDKINIYFNSECFRLCWRNFWLRRGFFSKHRKTIDNKKLSRQHL